MKKILPFVAIAISPALATNARSFNGYKSSRNTTDGNGTNRDNFPTRGKLI